MTQPPANQNNNPSDGHNEFFDPVAVEEYRSRSREFLTRGRAFFTEGDLYQASEKGWGAAAWMAKAVATAQGWEYNRHDQFSVVLNNASLTLGDDRLRGLRGIANDLHGNYYKREFLLNADIIELDLNSVAELLDILEPLTEPAR